MLIACVSLSFTSISSHEFIASLQSTKYSIWCCRERAMAAGSPKIVRPQKGVVMQQLSDSKGYIKVHVWKEQKVSLESICHFIPYISLVNARTINRQPLLYTPGFLLMIQVWSSRKGCIFWNELDRLFNALKSLQNLAKWIRDRVKSWDGIFYGFTVSDLCSAKRAISLKI